MDQNNDARLQLVPVLEAARISIVFPFPCLLYPEMRSL